MYCDACGSQIAEGQQFCRACGKPVSGVPLMPGKSRIAGHIRLLGILWIANAIVHLLPGFVLLGISHMVLPADVPPEAAGMVHFVLRIVAVVMLASAAAGLLAGIGLLQRASWARILALVIGSVNLISIPFGTALGIYTFWVLLPAGSEEEYERLSRAA